MGRACKSKGCRRSATDGRHCQMHGGRPGHEITIPFQPWPTPVNGHQVTLQEDLDDEVFYFYCEKCSSASGLGIGEINDATSKERARMKKYAMGIFMEDGCDGEEGDGPQEAGTNINVKPNSGAGPVIVNVDGDLDAPTKKAVANKIRRRKLGQVASEQNLNGI